ncbi:MAG: hypothetical protein ACTSPY_10215 [Candidatus Helarchaeota archaeon]
MTDFECTQCHWKGPESDLVSTLICPECFTGHDPLYRLMKIGGNYVCPNCDWKGSKEEALISPECPKCNDEYLKKIE